VCEKHLIVPEGCSVKRYRQFPITETFFRNQRVLNLISALKPALSFMKATRTSHSKAKPAHLIHAAVGSLFGQIWRGHYNKHKVD